MEPRASIDGFAPGPQVTRTGPRFRASRPMAEPVVRCMPGGRGAARRRDPAAALYGHGAEQAGLPSPPNGGFWSGRSVASAGVMPLACPHLGGGIPPAGRSAPSAALSSRRGLATRRAGGAWSPGRGVARATTAAVRGSGALSPTRGLEAPLHLAFRSLCSYPSQLAVCG